MPRLAGFAAAAVLLALSTGCSGNGTTSAESGAATGVVTEIEFAAEPGVAPGAPLTVTPTQAGGTQRVVFNIVLQSNR